MTKIQTADAVFNDCAADYERQYMDVSLYEHSFNVFCDHAKEDAEVLELGCCPGISLNICSKGVPDFKLFGTDLAPNMITLAKRNNPNADFAVLDARDIISLNKKFDAIMCGFCLPYLSKEAAVQLIADASALLTEGGILYISTMEDDYGKSRLQTSSNGDYTLFMYFHEVGYLSEALKEHGFEIISENHQYFPAKDGSKVTDLILIARKITNKVMK
ncbi:class I SAM-dependent methyltransferase [Flavobacterium sp. 3HN19-14]|uniref:class I SAM-dependent methyltransferase n=1 Tax=Flavobacterium sp. 3HN19-14 TaxID=3448133 RepID=UPI003EE0E1D9